MIEIRFPAITTADSVTPNVSHFTHSDEEKFMNIAFSWLFSVVVLVFFSLLLVDLLKEPTLEGQKNSKIFKDTKQVLGQPFKIYAVGMKYGLSIF